MHGCDRIKWRMELVTCNLECILAWHVNQQTGSMWPYFCQITRRIVVVSYRVMQMKITTEGNCDVSKNLVSLHFMVSCVPHSRSPVFMRDPVTLRLNAATVQRIYSPFAIYNVLRLDVICLDLWMVMSLNYFSHNKAIIISICINLNRYPIKHVFVALYLPLASQRIA